MRWNQRVLLLVVQASTLGTCAACSEDGRPMTRLASDTDAAGPSRGAGASGRSTGGLAGSAATSLPGGRGGAGAATSVADAGSPTAGDSAAQSPSDGGGGGGQRGAAGCDLCAEYAAPTQTGAVEPGELDALSGLAVSRKQPEILFAHNDHDRAIVYALDATGQLRARISLEDAMATDIEDIAVGPCDGQSCIYLADIGDNSATRDEYALLRFVEPVVPSAASMSELQADFERFRFRYDDGSHNAEALMVAPDGTVYVVTKLAPGSGGRVAATGPSSVYRLSLPLSSDAPAVAVKVATLPIPAGDDLAASAAAAHPCGLGFLVRTYNRVYEFRTPKGGTFEDAFAVAPVAVAMPAEPQSEGIDYLGDGPGFVSSGEGTNAPIQLTGCE
jgi:hypothetical protein